MRRPSAFHSRLFGIEPAELRDGYANSAIAEPPLELVLVQGADGEDTRMGHLGVEVDTTDAVNAAMTRLAAEGLDTAVENDTACCYAVQDKVWVHGPGDEPWEVYVVKADADTLAEQRAGTCCSASGDTRRYATGCRRRGRQLVSGGCGRGRRR